MLIILESCSDFKGLSEKPSCCHPERPPTIGSILKLGINAYLTVILSEVEGFVDHARTIYLPAGKAGFTDPSKSG